MFEVVDKVEGKCGVYLNASLQVVLNATHLWLMVVTGLVWTFAMKKILRFYLAFFNMRRRKPIFFQNKTKEFILDELFHIDQVACFSHKSSDSN